MLKSKYLKMFILFCEGNRHIVTNCNRKEMQLPLQQACTLWTVVADSTSTK